MKILKIGLPNNSSIRWTSILKKSNINTELSSLVTIKTEPGDEKCFTILGLAPQDHIKNVKPDPDLNNVLKKNDGVNNIHKVKIKKEPMRDHDERLVRIN